MSAIRVIGLAAGFVAVAAGCGTSARTTAPTSVAPAAAGSVGPGRGSGSVDVLYAGSLVNLMERQIGPGFHAATGYSFNGFAAGSTALAAQIKGGVRQADVFVSASPSVNAQLEGAANGDWVSWYLTFADSPLVLGYNPHSRFAQQLRSEPWYQVVGQPGFLLGRTDPATDPKGKLTVDALRSAAARYRVGSLSSLASSTSGVYPEETLVGRLQAGQLHAGFFYSSETTAASIPTVPLAGENLGATYTVTVVNRAPDRAGAEAFVAYLLGTSGQAVLRRDGFDVLNPPSVAGSGVPASLRPAAPGR